MVNNKLQYREEVQMTEPFEEFKKKTITTIKIELRVVR